MILILSGENFDEMQVVNEATGEEVENILDVRFEAAGVEGDPPEIWIRLLDMREERSSN